MRSFKKLSHYLMRVRWTCIASPFLLPAACFSASERGEADGGNGLEADMTVQNALRRGETAADGKSRALDGAPRMAAG